MFTPKIGQKLTLFFIGEMMAMTGKIELVISQQTPDGRFAYKQRRKRKEYYFTLKKNQLLFEGWDLPLKTQGETRLADGSRVMSGNACLNLEGMDEDAMRTFIEEKNLNPDVDKGIIICHNGKETLLYPNAVTRHAIIDRIKQEQGIATPA